MSPTVSKCTIAYLENDERQKRKQQNQKNARIKYFKKCGNQKKENSILIKSQKEHKKKKKKNRMGNVLGEK